MVCGSRRASSLAAALTRLLPGEVLSAATAIEGEPALAHEAERQQLARAVEKRRREFATGRQLAHGLLRHLRVPEAPLLPGLRRAPIWPPGVVGSISHGGGWCVAAVAESQRWLALGLDVEDAAPLSPRLWRPILRDEEAAALAGLTEERAGERAKLVFSAKECFYKALSPRLERVLAFEEVALTIHDDGRFDGELLVDDAGLLLDRPLLGCWSLIDDLVLTALAVPRDEPLAEPG